MSKNSGKVGVMMAGIGIAVTVIGIVTALVEPEIRCHLNLPSESCPPEVEGKTTPTPISPEPSSEPTARSSEPTARSSEPLPPPDIGPDPLANTEPPPFPDIGPDPLANTEPPPFPDIGPDPLANTDRLPELLLRRQGELREGDEVFEEDDSLYDVHSFDGQAGQQITINLESRDFDTYLIIYDPEGKLLEDNDNATFDETNSSIALTLPSSGEYAIIANGRGRSDRGNYILTVCNNSGSDFCY